MNDSLSGDTNAGPSDTDIDWAAKPSTTNSSSEQSSGEGEGDGGSNDNNARESKKQAKKLHYKSAPFLDLENHDALRAFILDHHDPWKAALDLLELTNTQKYDRDRVGVVTEVVTPCLRQRIPDHSVISAEQHFAAIDLYVGCRVTCFEYYDEVFLFSQMGDKVLLGEYLLEHVKSVGQCNTAEKVLQMFAACNVTNRSLILNSLLITFFKVGGTLVFFFTTVLIAISLISLKAAPASLSRTSTPVIRRLRTSFSARWIACSATRRRFAPFWSTTRLP